MAQRSPRKRRRSRLAAFITRKVEEHAKLGRDATKIAIVIALLFAAFMFANAFYRTWQSSQQAPAHSVTSQAR
jgi:hypothetical protein